MATASTSTPKFDGPTAELDEDALIKARLYSTEERHFKRIQKRATQMLDFTGLDTNPETETVNMARLQEEIELDFAQFEAAIMRVQLLTDANRKEVARYEEKKEEIIKASHKAKSDMSTFHTDLGQAQETKKHKLVYDGIAQEILSAPTLKPRQTQHDAISRLYSEISALEQEKDDYGKVWAARRNQFGEIVNALTGMQLQIQEDKEEQERREGLDDGSEDGEEGEQKSQSQGLQVDGTTPAVTSQPTPASEIPKEEAVEGGMDIDASPSQEVDESMTMEPTPAATPSIQNEVVEDAAESANIATEEGEPNPVADAMDTT